IGYEGDFSDALPKVAVDDKRFPVKKQVTIGEGGEKTSITYPIIGDAAIDSDIAKFIASCDWDNFSPEECSECIYEVSAKIVKDKSLTLHSRTYMYGAGAGHGMSGASTNIYRRSGKAWQPIAGGDFFMATDACHAKLNSMIYRRLKLLELNLIDDSRT